MSETSQAYAHPAEDVEAPPKLLNHLAKYWDEKIDKVRVSKLVGRTAKKLNSIVIGRNDELEAVADLVANIAESEREANGLTHFRAILSIKNKRACPAVDFKLENPNDPTAESTTVDARLTTLVENMAQKMIDHSEKTATLVADVSKNQSETIRDLSKQTREMLNDRQKMLAQQYDIARDERKEEREANVVKQITETVKTVIPLAIGQFTGANKDTMKEHGMNPPNLLDLVKKLSDSITDEQNEEISTKLPDDVLFIFADIFDATDESSVKSNIQKLMARTLDLAPLKTILSEDQMNLLGVLVGISQR